MSEDTTTHPEKPATGKLRYAGFLISNIIQKLGQLFLLGLLVFVGSTEDVYRFGLLLSFLALAVPVFSFNIHTSIGRIYYDIADPTERSKYLVTCLFLGVLGVSLGTILLAALATLSSYDDNLTGGQSQFGIILILAAAIFTINQFFHLLLRLEGKILPFVIFGVTTGLGALVFSAVGIGLDIEPLHAAIYGYSGAQIAAVLAGIIFARSDVSAIGFSFSRIKVALAYSAGTLVMSIVQWVVNYSGRWIGGSFSQADELASYTLVSQLLVAATMMCTTLYESSRSEIIRLFSAGKTESAQSVIQQRYNYSIKLILLIFGGCLLAYPIVGLIIPEGYEFPLVWLAAAFFQMMAYCFSLRTFWTAIGLYRTKTFGLSAVVGAICNLSFALTMGPKFGLSALFVAAGLGLLVQAIIAQLLLRRA